MSNNNSTVVRNGYDLPFVGNITPVTFYMGVVNFCLMLISCIVGISTIVVSLKTNPQRFRKWRNVDRFIVYKALNDTIYYFIPIVYSIHVTVEHVNYPGPLSCTVYAILSNVFGMSQVLMTLSIAITAFVLVYYNRKLTFGPSDFFLYVTVLLLPFPVFVGVAVLGHLGPNGFFCNFDGVTGWLSNFIIVSVGFTLFILITGVLYVLICVRVHKQSKKVEQMTRKRSVAKKRTLSIAKHSCLLILAFLVQFGLFIIQGIWSAIDSPPYGLHFMAVAVGSTGGVVNGAVFYKIKRQNAATAPLSVTSRVKVGDTEPNTPNRSVISTVTS